MVPVIAVSICVLPGPGIISHLELLNEGKFKDVENGVEQVDSYFKAHRGGAVFEYDILVVYLLGKVHSGVYVLGVAVENIDEQEVKAYVEKVHV